MRDARKGPCFPLIFRAQMLRKPNTRSQTIRSPELSFLSATDETQLFHLEIPFYSILLCAKNKEAKYAQKRHHNTT